MNSILNKRALILRLLVGGMFLIFASYRYAESIEIPFKTCLFVTLLIGLGFIDNGMRIKDKSKFRALFIFEAGLFTCAAILLFLNQCLNIVSGYLVVFALGVMIIADGIYRYTITERIAPIEYINKDNNRLSYETKKRISIVLGILIISSVFWIPMLLPDKESIVFMRDWDFIIAYIGMLVLSLYTHREINDNVYSNAVSWEEQQKKESEKDRSKLANLIKEKRVEKGYTQESLAKLLNISSKAISKWERGVSLPDKGIIPELGRILEIPELDLLSGKLGVDKSLRQSENRKIAKIMIPFAIILIIVVAFIPKLIYNEAYLERAYIDLTDVAFDNCYMSSIEEFCKYDNNREEIASVTNKINKELFKIRDFANREKDSVNYEKVELLAQETCEDIAAIEEEIFSKGNGPQGFLDENRENLKEEIKKFLVDYENLGEAIIEAGDYSEETFDNKEQIELWKEKINRW